MHQDSFETSYANGEDKQEGEPPAPAPPSPPPAPKTVSEKLELVKSEEAELLRQFEETHKRSAQV